VKPVLANQELVNQTVNPNSSQLDGDDILQEAPSRQAALFLLAVLCVVFLISILYYPPDSGYISICMFQDLTGLPCPGCGLTHSFCALAKGRLAVAFRYNALGPFIFLLAIGFWLRSAAVLLGRMRPVVAFDRVARGVMLARVLLVALGVYGVGRIAYIIAFQPQLIGSGPLLKLISSMVR